MNFLFLSCKKASELIEKKAEEKLSAIEEMQLSVHLSMCKACSSWKTQSKKLDQILKKRLKQKEIEYSSSLSDEHKKQIISQLNQLPDIPTSSS